MNQRPTRRQLLMGGLLGAALGLVVLGIGGRIAMRGIAALSGAPPSFSFGGSLRVVLLGGLAGLAGAAILLALQFLLPRRAMIRGAIFWVAIVLVTLRGLKPLDWPRLALFLPLVLMYGALLRAGWCKVAWRQAAHATPPVPLAT